MDVNASFHRNVLLLSQVIQPSDEFKKYFRENMFDKPNTAGFLHVSHYLLFIYDAERFRKLIEWPVYDKKAETKYRNSVKEYITIISTENPDIGFPSILTSHLIHAGGSKFKIIMWKLSQVVMRRYITRETGYNITFAPQVGTQKNIVKKFLQETTLRINSNNLEIHNNILKMESTAKLALEKQEEMLSKVRSEIFEKEQSNTSLSQAAPVHSSIKKRLKDINDEELIKMWKMNISKGLSRVQKKNIILKDIESLSLKVNNMSNNSNSKMLNAKQLQEINHLEILELLPPDMQCLLLQFYKDGKLVLNNFFTLFNFLLTQLYQRLHLSKVEDFSECLVQLEASCKDLSIASNIIEVHLTEVTKMISEAENTLCQNYMIHHQIDNYNDTVLSIVNNALILRSPVININTNCNDKESDLQKRLQLTPVEGRHKQLFSRYERLKQNHVSHSSKLRENLLASRINFDDTTASINNEKQSLHIHTEIRKNLSSLKQAEKYSRLFSTRIRRNNRTVNSSIISVPCSSKANSTIITNAIDEMHDISEFSLNISAKSLCNISTEFATSEKLISQHNISENAKSEVGDVVNDIPCKANVLDICETVEAEIKNDYDNMIKTEEIKRGRRSIGDIIERYKKLLEARNHPTSPKIDSLKCDNK